RGRPPATDMCAPRRINSWPQPFLQDLVPWTELDRECEWGRAADIPIGIDDRESHIRKLHDRDSCGIDRRSRVRETREAKKHLCGASPRRLENGRRPLVGHHRRWVARA